VRLWCPSSGSTALAGAMASSWQRPSRGRAERARELRLYPFAISFCGSRIARRWWLLKLCHLASASLDAVTGTLLPRRPQGARALRGDGAAAAALPRYQGARVIAASSHVSALPSSCNGRSVASCPAVFLLMRYLPALFRTTGVEPREFAFGCHHARSMASACHGRSMASEKWN
jgi:hypothetical protein